MSGPDIATAQPAWSRIHTALQGDIARLRPASLARGLGLHPRELDDAMLAHRHQPAARELGVRRVRHATQALLHSESSGSAASFERMANDVGFASAAALNRALRAYWGLEGPALRALRGRREFALKLPARYRIDETLAYLARDPASNNVRRHSQAALTVALSVGEMPVTATFALRDGFAHVTFSIVLEATTALACLEQCRRLLGFASPTAALARHARTHAQMRRLVHARPGLTVHQTASAWDALVWAILGQQISLGAAYSLLRSLSAAAGIPAGDGLYTLPRPARVAHLSEAALRACKLSRAKARTLMQLAPKVVAGTLDLAALERGSAITASAQLLAQHGIGPWTANYVMMRGLGFADCAPVGDAGLRRALQRFHGLDGAPDNDEMATLMAPFAPYRSLATFHLWRGFDDALPVN